MENDKNPAVKSSCGKFSIKEIAFFVISGSLFVLQAYFWKELITGGISKQPADYVLPIIATIGFAVIFALTATLATARWLGWLIFPVASIAAVLFVPLWLGSYIAALLIALALIYALYSTSSAHANSIKFNQSTVIKAGLSGTFTAIAFLMSFYYLNIQLTKPVSIIPSGLIESIVSFTSGIFGQGLQNQLGLPAETETLAGEGGGGLSFEGLPSEIKNLIPSNLFEIFSGSKTPAPSQNTKTKTSPEKQSLNFNQQIADTIKTQIDKLVEPYKPFIPYVFTVFFFLSIRGLMFVLTWFITPLAAIILKFLIALGIVRKEVVQIEAERVFF